MNEVQFVALPDRNGDRDGEGGWRVDVDGKTVIDVISDLNIGNRDLNPLWEALGLEVTFDYE